MAKSAVNKYQWPDGSWHSITWTQHQFDLAGPQSTAINAAGPAQPAGAVQKGIATAAPQSTEAPSAQPVDPNLAIDTLTANRNIAVGNATTAQNEGNLTFDYGYNADGTANSANPFSRAMLLEDTYNNSRRGTSNSLAAQGQGFSGALANAQGINDTTYAQNEAANRTAFQRAYQAQQQGQLSTYANNSLGASTDDFNSLLGNFSGGS